MRPLLAIFALTACTEETTILGAVVTIVIAVAAVVSHHLWSIFN